MITLSTPLRNSRLAALAAAIDAGPQSATLRLFAGEQPAGGAAPAGLIPLVTVVLPKPCAESINAGVLRFAAIPPGLCLGSGVPRWARLDDGHGSWLIDMDVGASGSGAAVELEPAQLLAGGRVQIQLAELRE